MLGLFLITVGVALLSLLVYTVRSLSRSRSGRRSFDNGEWVPGCFDDHATFDSGGHGDSSGTHADSD
jgi:hypothetical protein